MNEQEVLQEILVELKSLNKTLSDELERQSNERKVQALQATKNQEELAKQEQENQEKEIALEKLESERFDKIEKYFESQKQASEVNEEFRTQIMNSLDELEQSEQKTALNDISNKINVLVENSQVSEEQQQEQEVSHFTDLTLLVFFLAFVPAFVAYKGLSKLFDSAFA